MSYSPVQGISRLTPNTSSMNTLRGYRQQDLDAMVALDELCFSPVFLFGRAAMRRFAEAPNAHATVATDASGALTGFVITHIEARRQALRAYCVTLDVAPSSRHSGLGSALLDEAEQWARSAGSVRMDLHVHTGNAGAIRFYEALGYHRIRLVPGFYGLDGPDAFLYSRPL